MGIPTSLRGPAYNPLCRSQWELKSLTLRDLSPRHLLLRFLLTVFCRMSETDGMMKMKHDGSWKRQLLLT